MDKKIEFDLNLNWYGFAIGASVLLILLKVFGVIECSIWLALTPVLILVGPTVFIVFIVGIITCYLMLSGKVSNDKNDDEVDLGKKI